MKLINVLFYFIAMTAAVTDWREHRIPNGCCVAIIFLTIWDVIFENTMFLWEHLLGGVVISVPMFLLALIVKGSFGGGDIKFTAACGLFLGLRVMLDSVVWAAGAAGVYCLILLCRGYDRKTYFPLGPFLVFGMLVRANMC